jgi:hypothetical protein
MLLDVRHLAVGFLGSKEPGKVFPYAEIAVHFYESVAVLGHQAPKHPSLLCAAHYPKLAFQSRKTAQRLQIHVDGLSPYAANLCPLFRGFELADFCKDLDESIGELIEAMLGRAVRQRTTEHLGGMLGEQQ